MITLEINPRYEQDIDLAVLAKTTALVLETLAPALAEATVVIEDDDFIQTLNRDYREIDAPTDVLSFSADFTDPENEAPYLGDVIISYPQANRQAEHGGHPVEAEIQLLLVHGLLHLLGFDHADEQGKAEMWAIQQQFLDQLGIGEIQINS
ncbi:MAG: rRNA maturation RNase YbeY [Anaerolineales bacterium]|nr:rRNA maturation RNase YbeY [Anaerolineales bacterium]